MIFTASHAQKDSLKGNLQEVVITATRTETKLGNVAVPVSVIPKSLIDKTGFTKLQDVLEEQTGIAIVNTSLGISLNGYPNPFGQGVQIMGLDPSYTLILLDGEPLIGRNAGILKLGRLALGDIQQVEIVKGTASSLYGSEALAGVINIITETPHEEKISAELNSASFGVWGGTLSYGNHFNHTTVQAFFNTYNGDGYTLDPNIYGKTAYPFRDLSGQVKLIQELSSKDKFTISLRNYNEIIQNNYQVYTQLQPEIVTGASEENDFTVFAQLEHNINQKTKWYFRTFYDGYSNTSYVNLLKTGVLFDETDFSEYIVKPELQVERMSNKNSKLIAGAGMNFEGVNAGRYDGSHNLNTVYLFSQKEWYINKWTLIAGARLDKRADYQLRLSPRAAIAYKPYSHWKFTVSAGSGFKAPDFRHEYLNFFNSEVGYSLIGALELPSELQKLQQEGQISSSVNLAPYIHPVNLLPETSFGTYLSAEYSDKCLHASAGLFRNDINNLIDVYTLPFVKTNGESIFSYHNISRIFTKGLETNVSINALHSLVISAGYQFLLSGDKDVIDAIKAGKVFSRDPNTFVTTVLTLKDYGGLFNRSKNSGNFKISYEAKHGWETYIRFVYKGRFGFSDLNGNNVPDIAEEYVPSFWLCNISLSKPVCKALKLQAGIENLFNYTNVLKLPQYPGRIFFMNAQVQLSNIIKKHKNEKT